MKSFLIRLLAMLLVLLSVSIALAWELYFDERINTIPVLQAVNRLPKGHKVTTADFAVVRIKSTFVPEGALKDIGTIINYETVVPVGKGMVVIKEFFDYPELVPNENQMVTPIPNQWIFSLPGSLRRRDKVSIYGFPVKAQNVQTPYTAGRFSNQLQSNPNYGEIQGLPAINTVNSNGALIKDVTVAFAKDSANQEVKPSNDKLQRIDATGNISQLELILTPEQFNQLESKALDGYKFIFTYK